MRRLLMLFALVLSMAILVACATPAPKAVVIKDQK